MINICYLGAFLGGVLSFLSPCVLPVVPSYLSFITGISFEDFKTGDRKLIRKLTAINSLGFILGFSTVFISLGIFSSFMGRFLATYYDLIRIVGGIIIIFFGLYVMGVLKINFLSMERRVHFKSKPRGAVGSFVVGLSFAGGWTPCIGPILASILLVASTSGSAFYGFKLLLVYSAGLAVPFFITAITINTFLSRYTGIQKYMKLILILSGMLLIGFGIMFLTDSVTSLIGYIPGSFELHPDKRFCK
ncbi:MAG: cytochrome c biogenesis protein CcdA [Nitrospirae bacterium]|nr:cytochrome c biogenesis protein CcdA [Nitrospirota bacterium]